MVNIRKSKIFGKYDEDETLWPGHLSSQETDLWNIYRNVPLELLIVNQPLPLLEYYKQSSRVDWLCRMYPLYRAKTVVETATIKTSWLGFTPPTRSPLAGLGVSGSWTLSISWWIIKIFLETKPSRVDKQRVSQAFRHFQWFLYENIKF